MTSKDDFDARWEADQAARKAREEELRAELLERSFDGPHFIESGGLDIASIFGGTSSTIYAICLRCGSMVRLNDVDENGNERSIGLHLKWHNRVMLG